jgi:uncharacterized membrane protein YsdA (DUF1294 family)
MAVWVLAALAATAGSGTPPPLLLVGGKGMWLGQQIVHHHPEPVRQKLATHAVLQLEFTHIGTLWFMTSML